MSRQREKSEEARRKICEATIRCLAEHGYHGTSTTRIVAGAGVSRGAMQHHFPSKQDLIVAATNQLFEGVIARSTKLLVLLEQGEFGFRGFVEQLWQGFLNTKRYNAVLELMIAARTDAELKKRITPTIKKWNATIDKKIAAVFRSQTGDDADVQVLMQMTRCLLRGLVVRDGTGLTQKMTKHVVDRWVDLVEPLLEIRPSEG